MTEVLNETERLADDSFWTMVIAAGIAFIVFYFKSILTADIPLWLKLYLLGGK